MPRRHRRAGADRPAPRREGPGGGALESGPLGDPDDYHVRRVPGSRAGKDYRCPGCDQVVLAGTPHVVAWPDRPGGDDERRHWHSGCWSGRSSRGLTRRWS
ncbi:ATP/GTP-binding protein [Dietzia psychralcaliphila]|uniref:ATP/GTP-binding protein n=1 Tax=Dietzia psychralcaliphila TaxID=139021 RepID=UPI0020A62E2C|nr:ATP/GTP-binding protein [Dietzia psychralcaliphila]